MNNRPLVSVIITVYNGMPYLKDAVEALLIQTYENIEIIIVDDGSEDETLEYISSLEDKRIKVIKEERIGRGKALNLAISHSAGEFIAINDADDISLQERIEKQVLYLSSHLDYGLIGCNFIKMQSGLVSETSHKPTSDSELRKALSKYSCIQHSCVMMRSALVGKVGGYNESIKFLYDRDIYLRLAKVSKIANLPDTLVIINRHQSQYFLNTYKGINRTLHSYRYYMKAIKDLNLPKYYYLTQTFRFASFQLIDIAKRFLKYDKN